MIINTMTNTMGVILIKISASNVKLTNLWHPYSGLFEVRNYAANARGAQFTVHTYHTIHTTHVLYITQIKPKKTFTYNVLCIIKTFSHVRRAHIAMILGGYKTKD